MYVLVADLFVVRFQPLFVRLAPAYVVDAWLF